MNQTKLSLLTRLRGDRGQRGTRRTLHYYFVAQDIHERASSSHIQYQTLREHFRHSDVLFRFQRLMSMQGRACQQLSRCILLRQPYQHDPHFERAFTHIDAALERMRDNGAPADLLKTLGFLLNNLRAIDAQLATIESEQARALPHNNDENELADDSPHGLSDIWLRLSRHFTPESALFRHAVRMSLVLCFGYAIIQITGMHHGYWILLTSLFVCQPNYNATRHRLKLRIIGTLVGIAIGIPVLWFVPSLEGQLVLLVITGVLFFAFRNVQYAHATMFITLLVLLCFNLLGEGFEVALPRVIDTLIGCAIAWAAVSYIWPDWQFRNLPRMLERPQRPTVGISMPYWSNTIRGVITVWRIVLPAAMHTTVMLNWRRWYQICPANRTLPRKFAKPRFGCCALTIRLPAISQPSVLTGSS